MKRFDCLLKKMSKNVKKLNNYLQNQNKLVTFLSTIYLPLYHQTVYNLDKTNRELVSDGLLLILLTQFGFNVYSVSMLTLMELRAEVLLIIITVNSLATFIIIFLLWPMISVERKMRFARNRLLRAQSYLGQKSSSLFISAKIVRLQLKMVSTSSLAFAFTVGPLGDLTTKSVFEVRKKLKTKLHFCKLTVFLLL